MSLIEAMIALTISAIIAAYAMPSYRDYLARAHRAAAILAIRQAAQSVEARRLFAQGTLETDGTSRGGMPGPIPEHLATSPAEGTPVYRLRIERDMASADAAGGVMGFRVVATPVESGPMANDTCGSLVLDAWGRRTVTGGAPVDSCWSGT